MKFYNSYLYLSSITRIFLGANASDVYEEWCFLINEDYRPTLKQIKKHIEKYYNKRFSTQHSHVIVCTPAILNINRIDEDLATMLFEEKDIIKISTNESN